MRAVCDLLQRHRHELNLTEEPEVRNKRKNTDLTSYLENNPLKFCVLLLDAEEARRAASEYSRLLEAAERNVGKVLTA